MKREHCEALATCLFNTALILLLDSASTNQTSTPCSP